MAAGNETEMLKKYSYLVRPAVNWACKRFWFCYPVLDHQDFYQIGYEALIRAIRKNKYDEDSLRFIVYARRKIRGAIFDTARRIMKQRRPYKKCYIYFDDIGPEFINEICDLNAFNPFKH